MAEIFDYEVNWDELSVGSNESFFDRSHSEHEPFHKSSEFEERLAEAQAADDKENQLRKSRATTKDQPRPQAAVRPRSLPRLATKPRATIPVTPNVLKKRIVPKLPRTQPAPFVFKAKPAPAFHKSTGNINKVTTQLTKLHIEQPAKPAPTRNSRAITRCATNPAIRSKSVPQKERTIPVTPMVLKRQQQRRTVNVVQATKPEIFKAKPAQVLHRQPFKPKLNHNNNNAASAPTAKPFEFCLDNRLKDRKQFNSRTTEALEKRNKQIEEEKTRKLEEQRAAARRLTNFRATRNPFK